MIEGTQGDAHRLHPIDLLDINGARIGGVGKLYADAKNAPTWARVEFGIWDSRRATLVPLHDASLQGDRLCVPFEKSFIQEAPSIGSDDQVTPAEEIDLFKYYRISADNGAAEFDFSNDLVGPLAGRPQDDVMTSEQQEYVATVTHLIAESLERLLVEAHVTGTPVPDAEELAKLLEAGLPSVQDDIDPYFAAVGPFYDTAGAQAQLGNVTKQAVANRRRDGSVLAMRTGDGHWIYPAWQFTGRGTLHPRLVPAVKALRELEGWTAAVWLVSAHPELDGRSPREALTDGVAPGMVARLASNDSRALVAP